MDRREGAATGVQLLQHYCCSLYKNERRFYFGKLKVFNTFYSFVLVEVFCVISLNLFISLSFLPPCILLGFHHIAKTVSNLSCLLLPAFWCCSRHYTCYDVWAESTIQSATQCLAISLNIIPKQYDDMQECKLNMQHIKTNVVHLSVHL